MEIIISHESALEYWRLHGNAKMTDLASLRKKSLPANLPNRVTIRDEAHLGMSLPINLLVGSNNGRRNSKIVRSRVYTGPTPKGCFVNIGSGQVVSAPPFCFFQMAGELPLVKLIELGFELCGTYSLAAGGGHNNRPEDTMEYTLVKHSNGNECSEGGGYGDESEYDMEMESAPDWAGKVEKTLYGRPPLTSKKETKDFTANMEGVNGQKKARRALRYIIDGSASPMETALCMLLTLPHNLGGYGLPAPELNKRVDIKNADKRRARKTYYVCDLFWRKAALAVEYDSDFYHTGADRIARDSARRLDLATRGITVITLTSRQIRSEVEFEKIAKLIAGKLGKRLRYTKSQFKIANRELRSLLL